MPIDFNMPIDFKNIPPNKLNPLYFFNNHYNDEILLSCMNKFKSYMYDEAIRTQTLTQQSNFISGDMNNFTIDSYINSAYNLPVNTYTYQLSRYDIPYYNLKLFLDTYGYGKPISLIQIMEDHKVFKHRIIFSLGMYVFPKLRIIYTEYGKAILCIYPSIDEGISNTKIKAMIDSSTSWSLYTKPHSDFYYNNATTISNLFEASDTFIKISKFTNSRAYHKPSVTDKWDMLITGDASNPNLLYQTYATYGSDTFGNVGFAIASQIKNYVKNNLNPIKCFIINDYRRINSYQVSISTDNQYINLNAYGEKNPIAPTNIIFYKYDSVNVIKKNRFDANMYMHQYYPDVYALGPMPIGEYAIDIYESDLTTSKFDNNFKLFKQFMNAKYPGLYEKVIIEKDLPTAFSSYNPSTFTYDYEDYKASTEFGDIRSYNISKLATLRLDNPVRYKEYAKLVNDKNRKFVNYFQNMASANTIYNRTVRSTSNNTAQPSDIVSFNEDHLYLEFTNSENIEHPVLIYVDGLRVMPTVVKTLNNKTCAYIPKSKVTPTSIITAKMLLIDEKYVSSKHNGLFTPTNINTLYPFPNALEFGKINMKDLIFYNTQSREYIDKSKIDLTANVNRYLIEHPVSFDPQIYFGTTPDSYLITADDKYFKTNQNQYVILADNIEKIKINNATNIDLNKNINAGDTPISINFPDLINADISVTNTNNFIEIHKPNAIIGAINTLTFESFGEEPNADRFMVYANGKLLENGIDYTINMPLKYGDNCIITINPMAGASGKLELVADYMPYRQKIIYNQNINFSSSAQGLIVLSDSDNKLIWPFDYRYANIFSNGLSVSKNNIFEYDILDIIKINNCAQGDSIKIYYDEDDDFFNYYAEDYNETITGLDINLALINNPIYTGTNYSLKDGEFANFLFNMYGSTHQYQSVPV